MKALFSAAALALTLAGCAQLDAQTRNLLSSKVPAYAALDGVLFEGTATLFTDRTGTVQLSSTKVPDQVCIGDLRYTATAAGVLVLHCMGGVDVVLDFRSASATRGFGYGNTAHGAAAVAWGMSAANAAAYLRLPAAPTPSDVPTTQPVPAQ
ncbi:MAG: hypothetical protein H7172_09305 [Ferruginibacter sp.]|nr:hypothetical protein [Rhodoferax sp.]